MRLMDCRADFGDAAWACAQVWVSEGRPIKEIARNLNSTPSTVRYNLARDMPSKRAAVRPPAMSARHVRDIMKRKRLVQQLCMEMRPGPHGPRRKYPDAKSIARAINRSKTAKLTVSADMVRRDLHSEGFRSLRRQRGPKRVLGDDVKRVAACRAFLRMAKSYVKRICFSDEKYFDSDDHGADREWCPPGVQPSRKVRDTWAPRVHVWGVVGIGVKFLVRIPSGKLTAAEYKRHCLMPFMAYLSRNQLDIVLQYDGDKSHGTPEIRRYCANKDVPLLHGWPARSPDLSPIENLWAIVQKRVDSHGPSNQDELWTFIRQEWDAVSDATVKNLVESFRGRCERCVAAGGVTIVTKT